MTTGMQIILACNRAIQNRYCLCRCCSDKEVDFFWCRIVGWPYRGNNANNNICLFLSIALFPLALYNVYKNVIQCYSMFFNAYIDGFLTSRFCFCFVCSLLFLYPANKFFLKVMEKSYFTVHEIRTKRNCLLPL